MSRTRAASCAASCPRSWQRASQGLMPSELDHFLARYRPNAVQTVEWGTAASPVPLRIAGYLGKEFPPLEYVTSVRGVVFCEDQVLVMRNNDEIHVLPGGRGEDGEKLVETLKREVLEEAGWTLDVREMLGFLHLHHLGPKPQGSPTGFPYLYPDFAQVVFLADAVDHRPEARLPDDYEVEAAFRSGSEARELGAVLAGRLFLEEAVRLRSG
jgi:8-oxo-dGTP pyrophosphatase MutT (NUDIX family)